MRQARTTSLHRIFTVLALSLLLCVPGAMAQKASDIESGGDSGFEKKKGKRRGKFKKLKLKKRKRIKLKFNMKRKKTARELAEEAAAKAKKKQAKKKVKIKRKGMSAREAQDRQASLSRRTSIKTFLEIIPNMPKSRKGDLYFRLAENYWKESQYIRFQEMGKHNVAMEKWDIECRKLKDAKNCPKPPKPKLDGSESYRKQALGIYKRILDKFPKYARAAEVNFYLAMNLMEDKKYKEGLKQLNNLLKNYPKSRFIPKVYNTKANYFFSTANKAFKALDNYKLAFKEADKRLKKPGLDGFTKTELTGVKLRAEYMQAWCNFNLGEYEKTLAGFKKVIKLSIRYKKTKESKVLFENEGLRDLIRVYAKLGITGDAFKYFTSVKNSKYAYKAVKKLASRYYREGNYAKAIDTFKLLMGYNPQGERDRFGPEAPIFQNEIVRSAARIWKTKKIYTEVLGLVKYFKYKNVWNKRWRSNKKVFTDAYEKAEQTMLEYSTKYHKQAQNMKGRRVKKKKKLYLDFAAKLYDEYLRYFYKSESAYELRFFFAEILYDNANAAKGRSKKLNYKAKKFFQRAARQYFLVTKNKKGAYLRQAAFAEILCYEALAGRSGSSEIKGKKITGLRVDKKTGKVTWDRIKIKKWDLRLMDAYRRYLTIIKNKDERLQSYFKMGSVYYSYKHYLKSLKIFSRMAAEFPTHELSRRAAFMILYSYEDLKQWAELETNARLFLKDKKLTANKRFHKEMYNMLVKSSYYHIQKIKKKRDTPEQIAEHFLAYEKEFGKGSKWLAIGKKRGFKQSPRAANSLAFASLYLTQSKQVLRSIDTKKKMLKKYPKHKLVKLLTFEVALQYEQIADYNNAANWYETYFYGHTAKQEMTKRASGAEADKAKKKKRRKRRRRRRRRRGKKKKKKESKLSAKEEAEIKKNKNTALFKAAAYRRSLRQFDLALFMYRDYIKNYPKAKDLKNMYLAIAKDVFEDNGKYDKAIEAYEVYLSKYQTASLTKYLKRAEKNFQRNIDKKGQEWVFKDLKGSRKRVKTEDIKDSKLIYVHSRIARIHKKRKNLKLTESRYMIVNALGQVMFERKIDDIMKATVARDAYAESKFFLAERRRRAYVAIQFGGRSSQHKRTLKKIKKVGANLAKDYNAAGELGMATWTLAAEFRKGELYHLFVKKLLAAPPPSNLPKRLHMQYKMILENTALQWEDKALEAYTGVLQTSSKLGVYNEWVRKCEDARNEIKRQKGRLNPLTIFSKRKNVFWLVEPNLKKVRLNANAMKSLRKPKKTLPAIKPKVNTKSLKKLKKAPVKKLKAPLKKVGKAVKVSSGKKLAKP